MISTKDARKTRLAKILLIAFSLLSHRAHLYILYTYINHIYIYVLHN